MDYNRLEATEGIAKADSGNKLGTIVNTRDALVTAGVPNNCNDQLGLDLRPSSTPFDVVYDATGCSRTYDYAFKVPLYLDDDYEQSTASLYSGGNNPAITHKIHTHLVH